MYQKLERNKLFLKSDKLPEIGLLNKLVKKFFKLKKISFLERTNLVLLSFATEEEWHKITSILLTKYPKFISDVLDCTRDHKPHI